MRRQIHQNQNIIKDSLLLGLFVLGVMFLRLFYITRTFGPFIYADEFGYWSHAAHMTGHTWAGVMDGVSWYSFGYSFWLMITFLFSDKMVVMYRSAILLNLLMSLGVYALAYHTIRKYAKELGVTTCGLIAFAVTSFPTYIFYSYTTMAETLVALVVWLLFYELISLEEKPVWWKGILLGVTSGYAYMVHNRMLTAVLAVAVCLAVLWFMRKIDWRVMLSFGISFLLMIAVYVFVKNSLDSMVVANKTMADTGTVITRGNYNTLSAMVDKSRKVVRLDKMGKLVVSALGELWQFLSSTYLLAGLGVAAGILYLKKNIRIGQHLCSYAYPMIAVLISVAMTAVATLGGLTQENGRVRIDRLFYGRYNECYFPMIIMLALIMLCTEETGSILKISLGVIVVYLCLSVGMFFRLRGIENGYLNIVSSVSIHIFHWLGEFSVWKCSVIALIGGGIVVVLCRFKRMGRLGCCAGMLALVFLFSTTALYCMRTSIRGENDYTLRYTPVYDYLNANTVQEEVVYICERDKAAFDLQSRLVNKPVVSILLERLSEISEEAYVVIREEQMDELPITEYEVCLECEEFLVLRLK